MFVFVGRKLRAMQDSTETDCRIYIKLTRCTALCGCATMGELRSEFKVGLDNNTVQTKIVESTRLADAHKNYVQYDETVCALESCESI